MGNGHIVSPHPYPCEQTHAFENITSLQPHLLVSVATTRCQYYGGVGLQVNKFEQVSSDEHQVSVVGVGT